DLVRRQVRRQPLPQAALVRSGHDELDPAWRPAQERPEQEVKPLLGVEPPEEKDVRRVPELRPSPGHGPASLVTIHRELARFDSIGQYEVRPGLPGPAAGRLVRRGVMPGRARPPHHPAPDGPVEPLAPGRAMQAVAVELAARPKDYRHARRQRLAQ